ncbi:MAG: amino acid adenylation domain-containing protein [Cyanobacteria bacterium J06592_8]
MKNQSQKIFQEIESLSPEQRKLFERRLQQRGLKRPQAQAIPRRQTSDPLPLSFAQQRLWFIQQLDPRNTSYNVPSALRLRGQLKVTILEKTLNEIVRRHETLRTTFATNAEKQPIQIISPFKPFSLPVVDLTQLTATQAEIERIIAEFVRHPFDLNSPLLRLTLLQLGEADFILLMITHHIISDRWSIGVFLREMSLVYKAFVTEQASPLAELPIQYADWAIWQRQRLQGEVLEKQVNYWQQQLGDELPVLELPLDYQRPAISTDKGEHYPIVLSQSLSNSLKALAAQEGITLFTLLLASFKVLLHRYTQQNDIIIGTDIANRDRSELEGLIGLLVNTLVLRTNLAENPSFREVLHRVREVTLAAYAHQDLPFEKLVEVLNPERNLSQMMPLFQVKFDLQLATVKPLELSGLTIERLPLESKTVKYELRFNLQDTEQGITGQVEYNTDLFKESTIARLVEHFQTLLFNIVTNPEQRLSELSLLTETERNTLLCEWNNTQVNHLKEKSIHHLFEEQVKREPNAIALIHHQQILTYQDLNKQANQLAHYLQKQGIKPEEKVGICINRSVEMVVAILATLKAGGAYVPLDPAYPVERLSFILEDAQVSVLITQSDILTEVSKINSRINLDEDGNKITQESLENPISTVTENNLAYVIYTSGSTGKPKGVAIEHRSTIQLIYWSKKVFSLESLAGVLASTSICFDLSVFELFVPLSWGGKVILAENALELPNLAARNQVTLINTVPSAIAHLLQVKGIPPSVCTVNLAGEALQNRLVQQLEQQKNIQQIYNLYGPSEDTTYSTYAEVQSRSKLSVPIGQPINNTQAYILDKYLQPVPLGVKGELYLGGEGVARGYLNRPELTAEKFISDPFLEPQNPQQNRLYKTGDLVRYQPDGKLEFLGRIDHQVKIRGYRIEIGEIEAILSQYPALSESVVAVREDEPNSKRIVAYIVFLQADEQSNLNDLRRFLEQKLPSYMIPTTFVKLAALPRLPNGKINRKSLPTPDTFRPELAVAYIEPQTELEKTIAKIWKKELNLQSVGINDNFFELGGHSLLGIKVIAKMSEAIGVQIPLRVLFEKPTIFGLAEQIQTQNETLSVSPLPEIIPNPEERHQPFPLTDIQQAYLMGRSEAFELGNIATHGYREIETVGLKVEQVEQALQRLIEHHDMLRVIVKADGEQQILSEVPPYQIKVVDLQRETPNRILTTLEKMRDRLSHQILLTDRWPLFEIQAALLGENKIRFCVSFDVLIGDAWSLQIIGRELGKLIQNPETSLPPFSLSFRDYVIAENTWRESELYHRSRQYWQNRLINLPPSPELPLQQNLATIKNPRFVRRTGQLAPQTWQRIKQKASQIGITHSGVLLAAFAEILTTWSKGSRFTLNLTLFNRLPVHPEVNQIIGDFTSSLLLEIDNTEQNNFQTRAKNIQSQLWEDLDHRYVSGVEVLRNLARIRGRVSGALMPVVFTSTLTQNTPEMSQRNWQTEVVYSLSQTSQVYFDHQVSEVGGTLVFNWDTIDELFPTELLDEMFAAYSHFLECLADEEELWHKTTRQLLPESQLRKIREVNQTETCFNNQNQLLHRLFFEQVSTNSENIAVISGEYQLTYQELSHRALNLANQLQKLGVRPNQLVAVLMKKGWEQVVAVLGILAAGAAYVPIDPQLPKERQLHLLQETKVQQVITQSGLNQDLEFPENLTKICVDTLEIDSETAHHVAVQTQNSPQDLAYIIYTSGSTGLPKGVMINHQGAVNTILDINQRFNITSNDRVLALSALNFDLSVYDIFGILAAGGTLVIPDAEATKDPAHWIELIDQKRVTVWNSVPALMQMLLEHLNADSEIKNSLRLVLLSGDWLPLDLPNRIKSKLNKNTEVMSLGGATEASIWSILYPIETVNPSWKSIPYGRPMANQRFYVFNEVLEPCPVWVTGQLYIGGIALAMGYWRNIEKTNQSFIIHPKTQERLYKTGDLGRYLPDGNIEFLGREDFQVKVNGYRIELGEIESTLKQHSAIQEAIVTAIGETGNNQQLVAYILPKESQKLSGVNQIEFKLQQPGLRRPEARQPSIELQKPQLNEAFTQAYLQRQSYRKFLEKPILLQEFSQFISCLMQIQLENSPLPKYRYASAGSLYPVQTYCYFKPNSSSEITPGIYYYHPAEHRLILIQENSQIDSQIYGVNQSIFNESSFGLFLIGNLNAITPIYGEKAKDFCLLEAGYISQLLMEAAPKHKIGLCPIGTLEFESIENLFNLEPNQILLHSFVGGSIEAAWTQQWLSPETPQKTESIIEKLREFLRQKLPEYMIPQNYIILDELPLTPNGKIDRKGLPKPESMISQTQAEYIAPQTELQKKIAAIWQKALNLEKIGIQDNFFNLGGNSLLATQVLSQMRQTLQVEISIRRFFETPTIADLESDINQNNHQGSQTEEIKIERLNRDFTEQDLNNLDQISELELDDLLAKMLEEENS